MRPVPGLRCVTVGGGMPLALAIVALSFFGALAPAFSAPHDWLQGSFQGESNGFQRPIRTLSALDCSSGPASSAWRNLPIPIHPLGLGQDVDHYDHSRWGVWLLQYTTGCIGRV